MNYPNWPSEVSMPDTNTPKTTQQPDVSVSAPQPSTIQEAKAAGAVEGTLLVAPLAPSKGPIEGPAESMVVVTVKNFFDTPTWKAVRTVFQAAGLVMFLTFGNALLNVWTAGKSVFDKGAVDWRATERVAEIATGPVLVAGLMALMKRKDNNPSKG
jgi:hypothetical protein